MHGWRQLAARDAAPTYLRPPEEWRQSLDVSLVTATPAVACDADRKVVTTADGRFTALMPHPERVTRNAMMSWAPARWGQADSGGAYTPWMRFFQNARRHLG